MPTFEHSDAVILGVSADSVESHNKFATKFSLPFTLLSDAYHSACQKYGVWIEKQSFGKKYMGIQRATFLIGKDGKIAATWPQVKVNGHALEVAERLKGLE